MPQLRSGVRRGRPPLKNNNNQPIEQPKKKKSKATTARTRQRRTGEKDKEKLIVLEDDEEKVVVKVSSREATSLEGKRKGEEEEEEKDEEGVRVLGVGGGEKEKEKEKEEEKKEMDEYDSGGGRSGNKRLGGGDEGSTTPLPDRVQVGGSLSYKVEKKLGKGGFGQVYVGRRINPSNPHEKTGPGAVEVQCWFHDRKQSHPPKNAASRNRPKESSVPDALSLKEAHEVHEASKCIYIAGEEVPGLSELEFEARSSDGAWYDVDTFLTHRDLSSGEAEVLVRFVGFDADGDEWVNVKTDVRERSLPLEDSECGKVKVGDLIVCFQERGDEARYYDARVIEIQKRMHDIRGCRCLFLIQYDHDNTQERVRLVRLCCRPTY